MARTRIQAATLHCFCRVKNTNLTSIRGQHTQTHMQTHTHTHKHTRMHPPPRARTHRRRLVVVGPFVCPRSLCGCFSWSRGQFFTSSERMGPLRIAVATHHASQGRLLGHEDYIILSLEMFLGQRAISFEQLCRRLRSGVGDCAGSVADYLGLEPA